MKEAKQEVLRLTCTGPQAVQFQPIVNGLVPVGNTVPPVVDKINY
jgi:hypothetical protein